MASMQSKQLLVHNLLNISDPPDWWLCRSPRRVNNGDLSIRLAPLKKRSSSGRRTRKRWAAVWWTRRKMWRDTSPGRTSGSSFNWMKRQHLILMTSESHHIHTYTHTHTHACTNARMHTHTHMHAHMHTNLHVHLSVIWQGNFSPSKWNPVCLFNKYFVLIFQKHCLYLEPPFSGMNSFISFICWAIICSGEYT